jgi:hypothetical protein
MKLQYNFILWKSFVHFAMPLTLVTKQAIATIVQWICVQIVGLLVVVVVQVIVFIVGKIAIILTHLC